MLYIQLHSNAICMLTSAFPLLFHLLQTCASSCSSRSSCSASPGWASSNCARCAVKDIIVDPQRDCGSRQQHCRIENTLTIPRQLHVVARVAFIRPYVSYVKTKTAFNAYVSILPLPIRFLKYVVQVKWRTRRRINSKAPSKIWLLYLVQRAVQRFVWHTAYSPFYNVGQARAFIGRQVHGMC